MVCSNERCVRVVRTYRYITAPASCKYCICCRLNLKHTGSCKHPNSRKVLGSWVPSKSGRVRIAIPDLGLLLRKILRSGVIPLMRYDMLLYCSMTALLSYCFVSFEVIQIKSSEGVWGFWKFISLLQSGHTSILAVNTHPSRLPRKITSNGESFDRKDCFCRLTALRP